MDAQDTLSAQIKDAKTDENELEQLLDQFDLDESLAVEFDSLTKQFHQLEIKYQSLLNTRRLCLDRT